MIIFNQAMKRILSNKVRIAVMLLLPIIFIVSFALQDANKIVVGVVDLDQSKLSKSLVEQIDSMSKVSIVDLKESNMIAKTIKGKANYSIVIEKGFEENIISGEEVHIKEYYNEEKEKIYYIRLLEETFIQNMQSLAKGANYQKEAFEQTLEVYNDNKLDINNNNADNDKNTQSRSAMGFLVQFMLYMSVMTAVLICEDKSNGIFFRIFSSPLKLVKYIAQYMLAFWIIGIIQESIILILIRYVFDMSLGCKPILLFVLFGVFSMVCVSIGILLVSVLKKAIHAYIAIILLTTPMVMLGGCYWSSEIMPEYMQVASLAIPTTWVMRAVDNLLLTQMNEKIFLQSIGALLVFAAVFLAIGMTRRIDVGKQ